MKTVRFSPKKLALFEEVLFFDQSLRKSGHSILCGVDEAGRGPLAGPVVAAAVVLPDDDQVEPFFDSKQMTQRQREYAYDLVLQKAISYGIGIVDADGIDQMNILQATFVAMRQALDQIEQSVDLILIDGCNLPGMTTAQRKVIHGDAMSQSIGAASLLAKVTRDRIMLQFDQQYPEYGFAKHVGYGTKEHVEALRTFGPCPIHRRSFAPVRNLFTESESEKTSVSKRMIGARYEKQAEHYLLAKGYQCIEANWRTRYGEIDLIMQDQDTLVFVEVRYKHNHALTGIEDAAFSIDQRKRDQIRQMANAYLASHEGKKYRQFRFDCMLCTEDNVHRNLVVDHIIAAFE